MPRCHALSAFLLSALHVHAVSSVLAENSSKHYKQKQVLRGGIAYVRSKQHLKAVETLRAELEEEEQAVDGSKASAAEEAAVEQAAASESEDDAHVNRSERSNYHVDSEEEEDTEASEPELEDRHAAQSAPVCKHLPPCLT